MLCSHGLKELHVKEVLFTLKDFLKILGHTVWPILIRTKIEVVYTLYVYSVFWQWKFLNRDIIDFSHEIASWVLIKTDDAINAKRLLYLYFIILRYIHFTIKLSTHHLQYILRQIYISKYTRNETFPNCRLKIG